MIYYFPSCQFTAAFPAASEKIQAYLSGKPGVTVAGCCRPGQKLLTAQDTAVTVCMTCSIITREVSPQAREISIWEYLLNDSAFPWPDFHGEEITLQDCWRARSKPELLNAVRECMRRMNIVPVELPENREHTQFDGMWRFNSAAPGNLAIAPKAFTDIRDNGLTPLPKEAQLQRMQEWCAQYTTQRAAGYCNACVRGMKAGGANAVHLLELAVQNL